jgi:acyl-coenzyme A synthetase/AMP-(fatty) acid ligase
MGLQQDLWHVLYQSSGRMRQNGSDWVPADRVAVEAMHYAGGLTECGLGRGNGILIDITAPVLGLTVAFGAWAAGIRVTFTSGGFKELYGTKLLAAACDSDLLVTDSEEECDEYQPYPVMTFRQIRSVIPRRKASCRPDDIACDVLSTGTSGTPKVVVYDHQTMVENGIRIGSHFDIGPDARLLTSRPYGAPGTLTTVQIPALIHHADADYTECGLGVDVVRDSDVRVVYGAPHDYDALAELVGEMSVDTDRIFLSNSAALRRSTFDRLRVKAGILVRSFYCSSEAGTVTFNGGDDPDRVRDSVGRALNGVRLTIDADPGAPGPIVIGTDLGGIGIRRDGRLVPQTGEAIPTTDIGSLDEDGFLYLLGRVERRVMLGGQYAYLDEIEQKLAQHPAIRDCAVFDAPDGLTVTGFVVCRHDVPITDAELKQHCADELHDDTEALTIIRVADIPRFANTKVLEDILWQQVPVTDGDRHPGDLAP